MTRHMAPRTKAGVFAFLTFVALALAGCGNHDQANGSGGSGPMTPQQVEQNAQKQNQPPPNAQGAPTAPATQ